MSGYVGVCRKVFGDENVFKQISGDVKQTEETFNKVGYYFLQLILIKSDIPFRNTCF